MLFLDHGQRAERANVSTVIPPEYAGMCIKDLTKTFTRLRNGEVFSQYYETGNFSFWQHHIRMTEDDYLYPYCSSTTAMFHFMVQGDADLWLDGQGPFRMWGGLYGLFVIPPGYNQKVFLRKGEYISCHVNFSADRLKLFSNYHPHIKRMLAAVVNRDAKPGRYLHAHICRGAQRRLKELCAYNYSRTSLPSDYYFEGKVNDMIHEYLEQLVMHPLHYDLSEDRLDLMIGLKMYLMSRVCVGYDLKAFGQAVGVSESTLRRLFRKCFKVSLHEFYLGEMLEEAMFLLQDTGISIKEVAETCGYRSRSAFVKAFIKKFKLPPTYFRPEPGKHVRKEYLKKKNRPVVNK